METTLEVLTGRRGGGRNRKWPDEAKIMASWGAGLAADFTTDVPGGLLSVDPAYGKITDVAPGLGNIDGIVADGGDLIVSDWATGALMRAGPDGTVKTVATYPPCLADISAADGILYLPHMLDGRVSVRPMD